jgi:hypothetical protein
MGCPERVGPERSALATKELIVTADPRSSNFRFYLIIIQRTLFPFIFLLRNQHMLRSTYKIFCIKRQDRESHVTIRIAAKGHEPCWLALSLYAL